MPEPGGLAAGRAGRRHGRSHGRRRRRRRARCARPGRQSCPTCAEAEVCTAQASVRRNFASFSSSPRCSAVVPVSGRAPSGVPMPYSSVIARRRRSPRAHGEAEVVVGRDLEHVAAAKLRCAGAELSIGRRGGRRRRACRNRRRPNGAYDLHEYITFLEQVGHLPSRQHPASGHVLRPAGKSKVCITASDTVVLGGRDGS